MKDVSFCNVEDVNVRECFFVKVWKVRGFKVVGGRMMGSIVVFGIFMLNGLRGWMGVLKVGEDEGKVEDGIVLCFWKIGVGVWFMVMVFDC